MVIPAEIELKDQPAHGEGPEEAVQHAGSIPATSTNFAKQNCPERLKGVEGQTLLAVTCDRSVHCISPSHKPLMESHPSLREYEPRVAHGCETRQHSDVSRAVAHFIKGHGYFAGPRLNERGPFA